MKLSESSPIQQASWVNKATQKHLHKEIIREFSEFTCREYIENHLGRELDPDEDYGWDVYVKLHNRTTFKHRNMFSFVELEDGTLIGFNESPSHGWSFPVGKWRNK